MPGEGNRAVEIFIKYVGPNRPCVLRVPDRMKVSELRRLVGRERGLQADRLKLVLQGNVLRDKNRNKVDNQITLQQGCTLMVAVVPKSPAKYLCEDEDEDEDELIPQLTIPWKKKLFHYLHEKLRVPDVLLLAIFSVRLRIWACILVWFALAPVASKWDIGPLYILGTGFLVILLNLGKRQPGDVSAYSVFNEDFRELPGTLNADRLDRDIRAGQL